MTVRNTSPEGATLRGMLAQGHLRMILFAVLLAAASLTLSGIGMLRGQALENVRLMTNVISYSVEPALFFGDSAAAEQVMSQTIIDRTVRRVEVLDAQGKVFASWSQDQKTSSRLDEAVSSILWPEPEVAAIMVDGERIGTVRAMPSAASILSLAWSGLIIAVCAIGVTLIATHIFARRLQEEVVAPLNMMAGVAEEVREKRDFSLRVAPYGLAEIDRLASGFNGLFAELKRWHESLVTENAELAYQASHDPLTGLGNRNGFVVVLDKSIERAKITGSKLAIFYLDSNGFKQVNDQFGHFVGDMTLCSIADRLRQCVRAKDAVFRLGGDEFAIILEGIAGDDVRQVAARIDDAMREPFVLAMQNAATLSLSVGHAVFPDDGTNTATLVHLADERMYAAKGRINGR